MLIIQWTQSGGPAEMHAPIFIGNHDGLERVGPIMGLKSRAIEAYIMWMDTSPCTDCKPKKNKSITSTS